MTMPKYRDRYGIPGNEVGNLAKRFFLIQDREGWENSDAFLLWASKNGYKKGLSLRKRVKELPHSPDNSYFEDSAEIARERTEKYKAYLATQSPFCEKCTRDLCPANGIGCDDWRKYFVDNWNEKIHMANRKVVEEIHTDRFFRYEHPDLVREGIVFEGSCRL